MDKVSTLIPTFGLVYFLLVAANASNQLQMIAHFLSTPRYDSRNKNPSSLRKLIVMHEINSGNVALGSFNMMMISYGMIAGIICVVRVAAILLMIVDYSLSQFGTVFPRGSIGYLFAGVYIGVPVFSICFLLTMLSSRCQQGILQLINLIKGDNQHEQNGYIFQTRTFWVFGSVLCFGFVIIVSYTYHAIVYYIQGNFEKASRLMWYSYAALIEHKDAKLVAIQSGELAWWKKFIGGVIVLSRIDQKLIIGSALALFILIAKTLQERCIHFTNSLRDNQRFCVISRENVIVNIWKIKKAFAVFTETFQLALLSLIVVESLNICFNVMYVFKSHRSSVVGRISTLTTTSGFLYFLLIAAKASQQLSMLPGFLCGSGSEKYCRSSRYSYSNSLRKHVLIYEINSGNVGIGSSHSFVITYGFISGILCIFRLAVFLYILFIYLYARLAFSFPAGPTDVFIVGIHYATQFLAIYFLVTFLSSSRQSRLLEFINLIKDDTHHGAKGKLFLRENAWILGKVLMVSSVCIVFYAYYMVQMYFRQGVEIVIRSTWYSLVEMDRSKAKTTNTDELEGFELWKKLIGGILVLAQLDHQFLIGISLALLILVATTLESSCAHFICSIRDTRKYCVVSCEEIIFRFWRIRKAFQIVSHVLGSITLLVTTVQGLMVCINVVWIFKSPDVPFSATVNIFASGSGCIYFLFLAAKASEKLYMLTRFVDVPNFHFRTKHSSSNFLRQHIMMYEISSRKVGLYPCNTFVVTYGFIAGLVVTLLSNAAIVLQSFDMMFAKFAPLTTAEPEV
ncbi:unnamed protein product [Orchesella dallaii]|uniref:Uncharacterized protein n=1 Tax=Orchesella dallaii TaxID=48710 RepID=A0ABP1S679_9HEXA